MSRKLFFLAPLIALFSCSSNDNQLEPILQQQLAFSTHTSQLYLNRLHKSYLENPEKQKLFFKTSKKVETQLTEFIDLVNSYTEETQSRSRIETSYLSLKDSLDQLHIRFEVESDSSYFIDIKQFNTPIQLIAMQLDLSIRAQFLYQYFDTFGGCSIACWFGSGISTRNKVINGKGYSVELCSNFFQRMDENYVSIDSIFRNGQKVKRKVVQHPSFGFHKVVLDSLPSGEYKLFGIVRTFPNDHKVESEFYDEFIIPDD